MSLLIALINILYFRRDIVYSIYQTIVKHGMKFVIQFDFFQYASWQILKMNSTCWIISYNRDSIGFELLKDPMNLR